MMAASRDASNPLKGLQAVQAGGALPPVDEWNPPFCGDIDMRIAADGTWYYMNSPIGRKPLYVLFSRIIRKDGDSYVLVTPVEKCGIQVEDAPFTAIRMRIDGQGREQVITFETNVDDEVTVDATCRLRFVDEAGTGGLKPYVRVRRNLEALVSRALFYDLVAAGVTQGEWFGVWSKGVFFPMQKASDISA
jgi:uncharacterized protein